MVSCVAYGCTNRNGKQGITFHRFPKDITSRTLWVKALRRKDWEPSKYSCICSAHFREVDIDRTSLSCVRIRDGAVPSIFPSFPSYKQKKLGRLRKKLRKCDDSDEGGNMDAVVQQIIMNPPEVIIKEEPVVTEEAESDVGAGAQQPSDQMGQDQELPLIIKEEIRDVDHKDSCVSPSARCARCPFSVQHLARRDVPFPRHPVSQHGDVAQDVLHPAIGHPLYSADTTPCDHGLSVKEREPVGGTLSTQ